MSELETGTKWWMRYVIVPLLGGGGLIALVVAFIEHHSSPVTQQSPTVASEKSRQSKVPEKTTPVAALSAKPDESPVPPQASNSDTVANRQKT